MKLGQTLKRALSVNPSIYEIGFQLKYMLAGSANQRAANPGSNAKEVFSDIFENGMWATAKDRESPETVSDFGSRLDQTENIRRELPKLLEQIGATTFLDAPCGDLNWVKQIDFGTVKYIGGDIVPALIERLGIEYPALSFQVLDIAKDPLPSVDAWLCRDCLIHLPNAVVLAALKNFARSDVKYLLTSQYYFPRVNEDIPVGHFRRINLRIAPFNLPKPLMEFRDYTYPADPHYISVWSREQVAAVVL